MLESWLLLYEIERQSMGNKDSIFFSNNLVGNTFKTGVKQTSFYSRLLLLLLALFPPPSFLFFL